MEVWGLCKLSPICRFARFAICRGLSPPLPRPEVADHLAGGVQARRAADAAAGVGRGAAHIEAGNGRAVVGVAEHGPCRIELVEAQLAVKDVAADKPEVALEVEGRKD